MLNAMLALREHVRSVALDELLERVVTAASVEEAVGLTARRSGTATETPNA